MLFSVTIAIYNNVGNTELVIVIIGENKKTWSFPPWVLQSSGEWGGGEI